MGLLKKTMEAVLKVPSPSPESATAEQGIEAKGIVGLNQVECKTSSL